MTANPNPIFTMNDDEKRKFIRVPYAAPIQLKIEEDQWHGRVENFSTEGLRVYLDKHPKNKSPQLKTYGTVTFQVDGVDLESVVEVIRSSANDCGLAFRHHT